MADGVRLAGHTLRNEGRVYDAYGQRTMIGKARCWCGHTSDEAYSTDAARKRWHRDHKGFVRAGVAR